VVADIIAREQRLVIEAFVDEIDTSRHGTEFCGKPILSPERAREYLNQDVRGAIIAIGNCDARLAAAARVIQSGFTLETAIHPSSVVGTDVTYGAGTVIAAGAIVNPGTSIGSNVIINTAASVDHDCQIADGVHIAPGARLAGGVRVRRAAWVGIGAVVTEKRTIGERSLLGAGAVVVRDIPDEVVAFGNPARVRRVRCARDRN